MTRGRGGKLHVMHVISGLGIGGMELTMTRLIRRMAATRRHSVVVLRPVAGVGETVAKELAEHGEVFPLVAKPNDVRLPFRLAKLIRRTRPDVIHARNWGAGPDVAVGRLLTSLRPPLVFSFHGLTDIGPMPLRRRLAHRVLARMTTCLLAVSEASRTTLSDLTGVPPGGIRVIPNGVDTQVFCPSGEYRLGGRLVVGTVGSLTPVKNQALLVQACARLASRDMDIELRIAGQGLGREALLREAVSLGCAERLRLSGHVVDVPEFLRGLDVFVLPSLSEAHPNALIEAMACGLPCVGTRVGGIPEVLDGGRCGPLVSSGDAVGLADAITALAVNFDERTRFGRLARERACAYYGLDAMIRSYEALYEEMAMRTERR